MRKLWIAVLAFVLACGAAAAQLGPEIAGFGSPDLVLLNGKVVSMDDRSNTPDTPGHIYQAMAVKGKKIMALGTTEHIRSLAGPSTRVVDLKGKTVVPGLIESHAHTYGSAFGRYGPKNGLVIPTVKLNVETQTTPEATNKVIRDTVLNAIQAQKLPKGQWIDVNLQDTKVRQFQGGIWLFLGKVTRKTLDPVTKDYPVHVSAGLRNIYNGKAIEEMKKVFPEWEEHANDENRPGAAADGYEGIMTNAALGPEFFWKDAPLDKLAETFRMHGEGDVQPWGVTTMSTRIPPPRYIAAYYMLNRQGKMPYRLAYAIEVHRGRMLSNESTQALYTEVAGQWNTMSSGNDMLWCHGMANEMWDSLNVEMCFGPDLPASAEVKAMERCVTPDSKPWVADKAALMNGWRLVGTHGTASHGVRLFIQMLDQAVKEGSYGVDWVRASRPTMEHVVMVGAAPDIIAGIKKYGIILSIGPRFLDDYARTIEDYGEKARSLVEPIKTYLKEGIRVVGQMDSASYNETTNQWIAMYIMVSRKAISAATATADEAGQTQQTPLQLLESRIQRAKTVNPDEAIDRVSALKMWTTWAADYVLAEDNLGSLEVGKYADFAVLDRDFFTIPEADLWKVQPIMTGLNGKIVYDRDKMAAGN